MDLATWKANVHKRLATLARTLDEWTPSTLYGALAAMSLLPLVTSPDPRATLAALISDVGLNFLTNQIEAWKTRGELDEKTLAAELTEKAKGDTGLRDALDTVIEKLDV